MIEQINQLKQGSIISESSHYIVNRVSGSNAWLTHFESGEEVQIGMSYLKNYIDMDIQQTDKESGVRPVNINTIKYLIFDGVKYVVE